MRTAALLAVAVLAWLSDWPWLVVVLGLSWAFLGRWPHSPRLWAGEAAGVLVVEAFLVWLRRRQRGQNRAAGVPLEVAALGGMTLLVGTVPGILLWEMSLGRDALARAGNYLRRVAYAALLRTARVAAGVVIAVLYTHGL